MGGGSQAKEHPWCYLLASAMAATINFPLWRASAVGQSGFQVSAMQIGGRPVPRAMLPYFHAFFANPGRGLVPVVAGMTYARAAIFWGSDYGRDHMRQRHCNESLSVVFPPLVLSTLVQIINMPIVRASITLQNPTSNLPNVSSVMRHIYQNHGLAGLWHGTSAGILKSVPKYCTAVIVKDVMEDALPPVDPTSPTASSDRLWRSAVKSVAAGVAGAALTNPLDVIRNEMFKTNLNLLATVRHLQEQLGYGFVYRGLGKNLIAVSIPVACTIFFTDTLIQFNTTTTTTTMVW